MSELRELLTGRGFLDVRTLLNSGNAVFRGQSQAPVEVAKALEADIAGHFGFSVAVMVVTAAELTLIAAQNPLAESFADASKGLVGFVAESASLHRFDDLAAQVWEPEALAVGRQAVYLWCPGGVIESKASKAVDKVAGGTVTLRNWATVGKLLALVAAGNQANPAGD
jgi:uncharacterized protein (DUF1697 family)